MEQKNKVDIEQQWKEVRRIWAQALGYMGILAVFGVVLCQLAKQSREARATYLVQTKGNQKVIYAPIDNPSDLHVMEFGARRLDSLLYNAIHVGDTLGGDSRYMNNSISPASCRDELNHEAYVIYSMNGKVISPESIKRAAARAALDARRDSIIRSMQQKVK